MFTKSDLLQQYKSLSLKPMHYLRKSEFCKSTHPSMRMSMECRYHLYRGWVRNFDSAMQFYCNCIIEPEVYFVTIDEPKVVRIQEFKNWEKTWQGWLSQREIDSILCRPIPKGDFLKKITLCLPAASLLEELPDMTGFVGALQMSESRHGNDIAVLAQFEDEFIYAHWHNGG